MRNKENILDRTRGALVDYKENTKWISKFFLTRSEKALRDCSIALKTSDRAAGCNLIFQALLTVPKGSILEDTLKLHGLLDEAGAPSSALFFEYQVAATMDSAIARISNGY